MISMERSMNSWKYFFFSLLWHSEPFLLLQFSTRNRSSGSFCIINNHTQSPFVMSFSLSHTEYTEWGPLDCLIHFLVFHKNKNFNRKRKRRDSAFNKTSYNLEDEKVKSYLQNLILRANLVTANIFLKYF